MRSRRSSVRSSADSIPTWSVASWRVLVVSCLPRRSSSSARCSEIRSWPSRYWYVNRTIPNSAIAAIPIRWYRNATPTAIVAAAISEAKHRKQHLRRLGQERAALLVARVTGDQDEIQKQRQRKEPEHQQVEGPVVGREAGRVTRGGEGEASDQREPGVRDEVDQEVVRVVAPPQPADGDRDHADHGRRRAAHEDHRQDQGQQAARDLGSGTRLHGPHVARDGEGEEREEQDEVPVRRRSREHGKRQPRRPVRRAPWR